MRLADHRDETYLPLEIGKKIITNNLKVEPIFSLLERKYDVPLIEAEYKLEAVAAGIGAQRAANSFRIPVGVLCMASSELLLLKSEPMGPGRRETIRVLIVHNYYDVIMSCRLPFLEVFGVEVSCLPPVNRVEEKR